MKRSCYTFSLVLLFTGCYAQPLRLPFSDIYPTIGAYSKSPDVFSSMANQASLATIAAPSGGIYAEQPYLISELNLYTALWAVPLKRGVLGLSGRFSGSAGLQYSQLGIAYARRLSGRLDIGVQINMGRNTITGYGREQTLTGGVGVLLHLTNQLVTGIQVQNLGPGCFSRKRGKGPPLKFTMGVGYETSDKLVLQCDISKEEELPPALIPGIQYNIKKQVFVRAGIKSQTGALIAGAGLSWRRFRADVSMSYHSRLGTTPGLLLIIENP